METILQLKITLQETEPPVWRRILVTNKTTFFELHHIIQIAMGWENSHLFEFRVNNYNIGLPNEFDEITDGTSNLIDAKTAALTSVINEAGESFLYEYDFGDSWHHEILVEQFREQSNEIKYPFCMNGKLNCPPEDCGGIPGFYNILDIIKNKKHPERKEILEWLGEKYDPEFFDLKTVNKNFSGLNKYITKWLEDNG